MSKKILERYLPVLCLGLIGGLLPVQAGTISVAWDPLDHPDLAGYRVYYGTSPGSLNESANTGTTPSITLGGLASCTSYYVAVKGVAGDGTESELLSNVINGWPRPEPGTLAPQSIERGAFGQFVLSGDNFQPGASVLLSNPSVTVAGVTVTGCSQLVLDLEADPAAPLGPVEITVVNPDQVYGTVAGQLEVVEDQTAPLISSLQAIDVGATSATITWQTDEAADGQVLFRGVGETAWQETEVAANRVTTHAIPLGGLAPETEYEYSVRSTDDAGNVATSYGATTFTTSASVYTYMRIEAESATVSAPLESVADGASFNGAFVRLEAGTATGTLGNPSGTWDYGFQLPESGTWTVWLRMYAPTNSDDGWFEGMDGGGLAIAQATGRDVWNWVAARAYTLDAGPHTFTLGGYEPGVRVDRIFITDDPAFTPSEQPGGDVTAPAPVSALAATAGDAMVTLTWINSADSDAGRTVVRFRTDGTAPANPFDGFPLADLQVQPGSGETVVHPGLVNGTTYSYSVFALDGGGNVAAPATVQATPEQPVGLPGTVQNVRRTDRLAP